MTLDYPFPTMPATVLPSFADTRIEGATLRSPLTPIQHELVSAELALSCAMEMYQYSRHFVAVTRYPDGTLGTEDDFNLVPKLVPGYYHFGVGEPLDAPTLRYLLYTVVRPSLIVPFPRPHVSLETP